MVTVKHNTVEFRLFRPAAGEVHLVGDFTGWRCGQIRMTRVEGGYWTAEVDLPGGIYHFRYLADDQWLTDDQAWEVDEGPMGKDSVIWIMERRLEEAEAEVASPRAVDARIGMPGPQNDRRPRFRAQITRIEQPV